MIECCCIDPGDEPSVYSDPIRTACKAHTCCECGETITVGEKYEDFAGCWDGDWSRHKTCWFCLKIREDFFSCGWTFTTLVEDFRECHGWDYTEVPDHA